MTKKELERMPLLIMIAGLIGILLAKVGVFSANNVTFMPSEYHLSNTIGEFDVSYSINNSSNKTLKSVNISCTKYYNDGTELVEYFKKNIILEPYRTSEILTIDMYAPKQVKEIECKITNKLFLD